MARQTIHNRRAGRGSTGGGASWISYSDMMAALLLIFVLILTYSLYQYFTMLETKTAELEEQQRLLLTQQTLALLQAQLAEKENALAAAQDKLEEQQVALAEQARRLDELVGVRTNIIRDLSASLTAADLKAKVDENGSIVLDSAVLFGYASSEITEQGKALLNRFVPVYLNVLMSEKYSDFLGEIIIEGHTDSAGTYEVNLKYSQDRARAVALYVLSIPGLTRAQKNLLQQILTATGKSWANLVYDEYGHEDAEASRRVEFKFSLKDADMIEEMQRILQENDLDS